MRRKLALVVLACLVGVACTQKQDADRDASSAAAPTAAEEASPVAPRAASEEYCLSCREKWCRNYLGTKAHEGVDVVAGCFDDATLTGVAENGPKKGTPRTKLCEELYECSMRRPTCAAPPYLHGCYCGEGLEVTECVKPDAARGPCAKEIEAAAESTDPTTVAQRFSDPTFAVGGWGNLLRCYQYKCQSECLGIEPEG